jgi:SAM-dependent methyltransferase
MAFSIRDVPTFLKSARTDARATALRRDFGAAEGFNRLYAELGDPWLAEARRKSSYQHRKNCKLVGLLPAARFDQVLDLGCGLGGLTRLLAGRAGQVVGTDVAASAVAGAKRASADFANLGYVQSDILNLPAEFTGRFDVVIVADVLYYIEPLSDAVLKQAVAKIAATLKPNGHCLVADHYFSGFDRDSRNSIRIHDAFRWSPSLHHVSQRRGWFYVADLLRKSG